MWDLIGNPEDRFSHYEAHISYLIFQKGVFPDLLATSGDYLRVWRVGDTETRLECLLNNVSKVKPAQKATFVIAKLVVIQKWLSYEGLDRFYFIDYQFNVGMLFWCRTDIARKMY